MRRIYAYKKDCYVVDQIRLILATPERLVEITEDDPAYEHLCVCLQYELGIGPGWRLEIALKPAFEPGLMCLYPAGCEVP